MKKIHSKKATPKHGFIGTWHITAMEMWDDDYFNEEVQAYVKIGPKGNCDFHFGYVRCDLDGSVEEDAAGMRFVFTFEGADEMDPVSGYGWMRLQSIDDAEGLLKFHGGEKSTFTARRVA